VTFNFSTHDAGGGWGDDTGSVSALVPVVKYHNVNSDNIATHMLTAGRSVDRRAVEADRIEIAICRRLMTLDLISYLTPTEHSMLIICVVFTRRLTPSAMIHANLRIIKMRLWFCVVSLAVSLVSLRCDARPVSDVTAVSGPNQTVCSCSERSHSHTHCASGDQDV